MVKLAIAVVVLACIGAVAGPGTAANSAPSTQTTLIDPTTAPLGGEPGIPAGPPNPGFGLHCGYGHLDDDVRGVVKTTDGRPNPDCDGQR